MRRGQITGGQLFWVAFSAMFPTINLLLPGDLLRLGGRSAWWTPLLAAVPACAFAWAVGAGGGRCGDLVRAARHGLGPVFGRVVLLLAWAAMGVYTVLAVRESIDLSAQTFIFREVPVPILALLGLIPAAVFAWLGPVVIARVATLLAAAGLTVYLGVLVASLPMAQVIWALPLLPRDLRFASLHPLDLMWIWLVEPALVGSILMHRVAARDRGQAGKILAAAVAAAALSTAAGLWVMTANIGPQVAATLTIPLASLVRGVDVGNVQHLDTLVLPTMVVASALKVGIFFYVWARLGAGLLAGWARIALAVEVAAAGVLAIVLLPSPSAADRALYAWAGLRALPVLAGALPLAYALAAVRRGVRQR